MNSRAPRARPQGLTTPRGAVPNGPGCQENDPRRLRPTIVACSGRPIFEYGVAVGVGATLSCNMSTSTATMVAQASLPCFCSSATKPIRAGTPPRHRARVR